MLVMEPQLEKHCETMMILVPIIVVSRINWAGGELVSKQYSLFSLFVFVIGL